MKIMMMTQTALAAALICILSPFTIMLPFSPVPVSLTIFAIFIAVYAVGLKWGMAATALYILIGLAGIPVFSGFSGGVGKLMGPTGGYIFGYLFVALLTGIFTQKWENRAMHVLGMLSGTLICYLIGTIWLAKTAGMGFSAALYAGVIPFIPADVIKIGAAALIGPRLRGALQRIRRETA